MKKVLQPLMIAALAMPAFAFANSVQTTTPDKVQQALGAKTAQVQVSAAMRTALSQPTRRCLTPASRKPSRRC